MTWWSSLSMEASESLSCENNTSTLFSAVPDSSNMYLNKDSNLISYFFALVLWPDTWDIGTNCGQNKEQKAWKTHLLTENKNFATGLMPVHIALGWNQVKKWHFHMKKAVNPDALEDFSTFWKWQLIYQIHFLVGREV